MPESATQSQTIDDIGLGASDTLVAADQLDEPNFRQVLREARATSEHPAAGGAHRHSIYSQHGLLQAHNFLTGDSAANAQAAAAGSMDQKDSTNDPDVAAMLLHSKIPSLVQTIKLALGSSAPEALQPTSSSNASNASNATTNGDESRQLAPSDFMTADLEISGPAAESTYTDGQRPLRCDGTKSHRTGYHSKRRARCVCLIGGGDGRRQPRSADDVRYRRPQRDRRVVRRLAFSR